MANPQVLPAGFEVNFRQATLWIASDTAAASSMFIWTGRSRNIGIIEIDLWGHITGHKTLPRAEAKALYLKLRKHGATTSEAAGVASLPDYKRTIKWLLERI